MVTGQSDLNNSSTGGFLLPGDSKLVSNSLTAETNYDTKQCCPAELHPLNFLVLNLRSIFLSAQDLCPRDGYSQGAA